MVTNYKGFLLKVHKFRVLQRRSPRGSVVVGRISPKVTIPLSSLLKVRQRLFSFLKLYGNATNQPLFSQKELSLKKSRRKSQRLSNGARRPPLILSSKEKTVLLNRCLLKFSKKDKILFKNLLKNYRKLANK
uniref:Orf131 n=1 Tax=Ancoracysta twista TaxID=2044563 RepID=A0A2H4R8G8_9EUKA|nr:orf131 [Ancoracysta twista]ATY40945.1 orf131 [Ancoracysta twista]